MERKYFEIYSKKKAYELRLQGFRCIGTRPNDKFPQFDVYLFENTEELKEAFSKMKTTEALKDGEA